VQGGYGALFTVFALHSFSEGGPGTNFAEHYACRVTKLNGAENLSPVTKLMAGTGAVSRYKLSRSQKIVMVQDFDCGQMRVPALSGAKGPGATAIMNLSCVQEQKQKV